MGRISGSVLIGLGILLWYAGGRSGQTALVNLGIGSILLGFVVFPMPGWRQVGRDALELAVEPNCTFVSNLIKDLDLKGKAVVIPPYENLPSGGIFIPASEEFHVPLGKLSEGTVLVAGTRQETGLLISPVPGSGVFEYIDEDLGGTGIGYAVSAVSSALSALGLGSAEVFEEGEKIEAYVKPICGNPYVDPAVSAVLLGIAVGSGELILVEDVERVKDYFKLTLRKLGGVERWL